MREHYAGYQNEHEHGSDVRRRASECNQGKGRPAGHDANHAKWHGPYATLSEAREASHHLPGVLIRSECKCI